MKIIDAHTHLGSCDVFDLEITREELLSEMARHGVDASIVQPFPGCPKPEAVHDAIAGLAREQPGRFYGVASSNPHFGEGSFKELRRCVEQLGFVGIKLHTIGHAVIPGSKIGIRLAELADELGVPLLVHTGTGAPIALPSMCLPLARRFPKLKIILCHAGYAVYAGEAVIVAKEAPNVYLEPSWCTSLQLKGMVKNLGTARLLFGTDGPVNLGTELAKARTIGLSDADLEQYLGGTAQTVFGIA